VQPSGFDRFDDQARRAVVLSELYAKQEPYPTVTVDHLALALLTPPVVDQMRGLPTFDEVGAALEEMGDARRGTSVVNPVPFDGELRVTVARSIDVADASGDRAIGPEHLLIAVLRSRSNAAVVLAGLGLDASRPPADWRAISRPA
jgi:hypothetical protein